MIQENPGKSQLGDRLMKAVRPVITSNGVPYFQMRSIPVSPPSYTFCLAKEYTLTKWIEFDPRGVNYLVEIFLKFSTDYKKNIFLLKSDNDKEKCIT